VNSPYGITFAHVRPSAKALSAELTVYLPLQNGNLVNTQSLMQFMDEEAHRHINTASDSELLLNIFAYNLQQTGKFRINEEDIFTALIAMVKQVKGAYACVAMLAGFGLIAFRDPNGIRPVGIATRPSTTVKGGTDWIIASESVVADANGFSDWDDVKPGTSLRPFLHFSFFVSFKASTLSYIEKANTNPWNRRGSDYHSE